MDKRMKGRRDRETTIRYAGRTNMVFLPTSFSHSPDCIEDERYETRWNTNLVLHRNLLLLGLCDTLDPRDRYPMLRSAGEEKGLDIVP